MKFENIEHLLKWYFRKKWLKPPKEPGNHEPDYIYGGGGNKDPEAAFVAIMRIKPVIEGMSFRERSVIKKFYSGIKPSVIAVQRGYSEKTLRRVIARINDDLVRTFSLMGMLWEELRNPLDEYYEKEEI